MIRLASGSDVSLTSTWRIVGALSLAAYVFLVVPAESAETTQVASIPADTTTTGSGTQTSGSAGSSSTAQANDTSSAQQTSQPPEQPSPDQQQVDKKPKQQDTEARTSALAATGDSSAGSIGGIRSPENAKVSSGGAATYSIPITVPPGTAGVTPKLAFTYNSQGENGLLGVGWSVSGLPVIHRCGATFAQDGFKRGVNYDANDRFCLDGARLMAISGGYGANGTEYRTEVDSFVKVISYGASGNGPSYFKVWTKSGETMEFGGNATSDQGRIEAQGKASVRVWALSKAQDTKGNYLTVSYGEDAVTGEYRPLQIDYTGNAAGGLGTGRKVEFIYESRPDIVPLYVGGSIIKTTVRLKNVKTYLTLPTTTLVRDYQLQYQTGTATSRSRLTSVTECTSSCAAPNGLPPNTFTWREGGNGNFDRYAFSDPPDGWQNSKVWAGDFDANGKTDLVTNNNNKLITFLSFGNGTYDVKVTGQPGTWDGTKVRAGDFNSDGRTDLVSHNNNNLNYLFSQGNGTYQSVPVPQPSGWDGGKMWAGDFDGDGRVDLASHAGSSIIVAYSKDDGNRYDRVSFPDPPDGWDSVKVWVGDFNSDGIMDLATHNNNKLITILFRSDRTIQSYSVPQPSGWSGPNTWALDVNGDGSTDLVSHNNGQLITAISRADGAYDAFTFSDQPGWTNSTVWVGDFNGDRRDDIASHNNGQIITFFSLGNGTYQPVAVTDPSGFDSSNVWPGDFSGDGKLDLASHNNGQVITAVSNGLYPDLAITITNMFGGTNNISYQPLTNNSIYAKDTNPLAYPKVHVQYPLYVVANLDVSNGMGTTHNSTYRYGGARADHRRGPEGFRWMETNDVSPGVGSRTTGFYNQEFPKTGLPDAIEIDRISDGAPFRESFHAYLTNNPYPSSPTTSFVGLSQQDVKEWEGGGTYRTITKTFEYDSFVNGNLKRTYHYAGTGVLADDRDEKTDWMVDATNWLHRPKRAALYNGAGALLREKWLFYDNQAYGVLGLPGFLTKEESNAGGGMGHADNPIFTFAYDAFGNRTSVADPRGCTTTTTFETTYRTFPATVTVCSNVPSLNFVATLVFDARFGVKTSETDPNSQNTTFNFDSLGRLTKATGPLDTGSLYGTVSHFYINWGDPASQRITTHRTEQHGTANYLWNEDYFDGLGRVEITRNEGPGAQPIETRTTFDSRNLVLTRIAPYFVGTETAPPPVVFEYDVLGRETKVTNPDGTFATRAYDVPGKITLTDERSKVRRKFIDVFGRLEKVEEINGSETYITNYDYDAAGSLRFVTNHFNHITEMRYDLVGRKNFMQDPNMGTWTYSYLPAGDLKGQTDAKNQTLCFQYDPLGRPLTKKQGTTSSCVTTTTTLVTWTYDEVVVPFSKGRLTRVVDLNTDTRFSYDQLA